jgi:hypothetical protein
MEMQLKHYKLSYLNVTNALSYHDGLAIISFLFEADDDSDIFEPFEVQSNLSTTKVHRILWVAHYFVF